jgi:ABC-2 type transport system permease protein/oleandomycin transport system permease protein
MSLRWWLADSLEMVKRNLRHIRRTPELLLDVTVQPIMFVVLFRFVFGGAIPIEGTTYVNYLMAGIFVQTIAFAGMYTGVLLANDLKNGMIDRFRSLPMNQSSVLTGRTMTDLLRAMLAVTTMTIIGLLVGFRPQGGIGGAAMAIGVMLAFGFALSWVGVAMGAFVRTPEALQGLIFMTVFPLTFASSAFVPTTTMPDWLRVFAEHQPVTLVTNTVRSFTLNGTGGPDAIPALLWSAATLVVFFPIALWLYRRRTTG